MEENKEEQVAEQSAQEQTPEVETIKAYPTGENSEEKEPEQKKKGKKGLVIFLLLLIIVIGCGAYYYFNIYKKDSKIIHNSNKTKYEYTMKGNSLENFDLKFMQLENNGKNMVYSPLSIKYALAMLSEGAKGETKQQIDNIIGEYKTKKYPNNKHMSFANAMFIRNTFQKSVKEDYTKTLKDKFNAEVILDPFANPNNINNWVSNKTFKLINDLVDDVSKNDFFLINALAIDMNWNNQIHCATGSMDRVPCIDDGMYEITYSHEKTEDNERTRYHRVDYPYTQEREFYHLDFNGQKNTKASRILSDFNRYDIIKDLGEEKIRKTVGEDYKKYLASEETKAEIKENPGYIETDVNKFLDSYIKDLKSNYGSAQISTDYSFYVDDNVKVFAKDLQTYEGQTLQYVGIMPIKTELTEYVKNLKADAVNKIINNLKEAKLENMKDGVATIITGDIPLFKFDYELKLDKDLKELGIKNIFSKEADLSNMVEGPAAIDKAIHKAEIEFSNEGIKAAAASAIGGFGATTGGYDYLFKIPVEKIDLTFDKPYMYVIRDKDSGEVWFTGTVYEPIQCPKDQCTDE